MLRKIAEIFAISLELLINSGDPTEGEAEIIDAIASGRDIVPQNPKDVVNLAPLLKPSVLTLLSDSMTKQGIGMSQVLSLAEFLNESDTQKLIKAVSFDSLAEMDMNLLERLLPLLGPYAADTIFQKIIDGELDYHYLEMLGGYSVSQIESAVIYGVIDSDALNIIRRNAYDSARMKKRGVIKLFTCPSCAKPLPHFHPRRCKCGLQPPIINNILRLCANPLPVRLEPEKLDLQFINKRFGDELLILILGAVNIADTTELYNRSEYGKFEIIVLDSDITRLCESERSVHANNYSQMLFTLDDMYSPHIMPACFDLIIDNTSDKIGQGKALLSLLKKGGCLLRGGSIVCEA